MIDYVTNGCWKLENGPLFFYFWYRRSFARNDKNADNDCTKYKSTW